MEERLVIPNILVGKTGFSFLHLVAAAFVRRHCSPLIRTYSRLFKCMRDERNYGDVDSHSMNVLVGGFSTTVEAKWWGAISRRPHHHSRYLKAYP